MRRRYVLLSHTCFQNLPTLALLLVTFCYAAMGLSTQSHRPVFIGFDFGTSGARVSVIEHDVISPDGSHDCVEVHSDSTSWKNVEAASDANEWIRVLEMLLERVPNDIRLRCRAICASGTSASCVLIDSSTGEATRGGKARMYNYDVISTEFESSDFGKRAIAKLNTFAPDSHTAKARTSSLEKLLSWNNELRKIDSSSRLYCVFFSIYWE